MTPHRSLHCIPSLGGGGSERQLAYLAPELKSLGWEVHVAYLRDGINRQRLIDGGAVLHPLTGRFNADPSLIWQLTRLIGWLRPTVVQSWLLQMDVLVGIATRISRTPWVVSERSSAAGYPNDLKSRLRQVLARHAQAVIANSAGGLEYWQPLLSKRVRRFVIPNLIPFDELATSPAADLSAYGLRPGESALIYVGRLDAGKNCALLLEALRLLPARYRIKLFVCGDGPLRSQLERLRSAYQLDDRVVLLGYVPQVWNLLKTANLFVSASRFEGQPNAVIEAIACGCPVVVSDIPGHRELLDDTTAGIVRSWHASDFAAAIAYGLDNPQQSGQRGQAAYARLSCHGPAGIAARYHAAYTELLASPHREPSRPLMSSLHGGRSNSAMVPGAH